jgi:hypothetical protein
MKSDFLKTSDGVQLHYLEAGTGQAILFIPGATAPGYRPNLSVKVPEW